MALSGTLNSTDYQGRYVQLTWTGTPDIARNQTSVKWTLKGAGDAVSSWYNSGPFYVAIAGSKVYESDTRIKLYKGTTIASGTKVITHDSDGSKDFSVNIKAAIYSNAYNCSASKTFTLDDIPRAAAITSASNFNDEGTPSVKYSNPAGSAATVQVGLYWDSSTALVPYTTVTGTSGTKNFTLTTAQKEAIYSKLATVKSKTIYYYIKTVIGGNTFTSRVAKTVSITNATPTLSPTAVEDTNAETDGGDAAGNIKATGSNLRWLKGISDVRYAFNASAKKGASIKSYKVVCGSKSGSSSSGVLYNVDSGSIKFTVTDSRGNTATVTLTRTLIDYVKLTCSISATAALNTSTTAKATIKISGKFFNGNISADSKNTLALWYRYKEEGGSYNSWLPIDANISGNSYDITFELPEVLDYQKAYTFQARAGDDLYAAYGNWVASEEVTVITLPVFNWGKDYFNFNVPVQFKNNNILYGITTEGNRLNCFQPCNNNNNCVLGYGGYTNNIGATNIYGNDINLLTKSGLSINDGNNVYSLLGLAKALSNRYTLTVNVTPGSNYSAVEVTAILIGNCIRFYYSFTRKSASNVGNITNDTIATVKVTHGGKVATIDNVSFINGATGNIASFYTGDVTKIDNNSFSFNIVMSATAAAVETSSGYFVSPVTLNLDAY